MTSKSLVTESECSTPVIQKSRLIIFSRAISHARVEFGTIVSEISSVSIIGVCVRDSGMRRIFWKSVSLGDLHLLKRGYVKVDKLYRLLNNCVVLLGQIAKLDRDIYTVILCFVINGTYFWNYTTHLGHTKCNNPTMNFEHIVPRVQECLYSI